LKFEHKKIISELPLHEPITSEDIEEYLFNTESSPSKEKDGGNQLFLLRYE
jgi:hypothetical protein